MYGVYQLLEKLGCGFYLAGDTFPPAGTPLLVADSLDELRKPVFAVRGTLPWGNLLNAYWDLEDWKFYFDQLSKQGYNFVGLHGYCTPWHERPAGWSSSGRARSSAPIRRATVRTRMGASIAR